MAKKHCEVQDKFITAYSEECIQSPSSILPVTTLLDPRTHRSSREEALLQQLREKDDIILKLQAELVCPSSNPFSYVFVDTEGKVHLCVNSDVIVVRQVITI
ncbi:hypothetical protein WMY93_004555 [Mugilogobius chulae]|uniref:Uncharacterized protein n=1 Tax=Mugilogobius chulae TaxID=88201 RepID=A0AAW0PRI3_9GOBI